MTESVLERVARGDERAVRECINEFGGLVWAIARRMTRSRADAEDAVQEIFIDVWRSAARFDATQGSEKVFITTIARRRLIDRIRRARSAPQLEGEEALEGLQFSSPGDGGEIRSDAERAAAVVARLRPEQRKVLRMGLLEGLTHSEIAGATGMPLGTVKTQMRRGLMQVRDWLKLDAPAPRMGAATP
ncbi:MAG TPA: sigma-70 family RNA polymerase sigma factor [Steroidobacteraceae bacterium]|nr:sigma-70 family RNA polymerase sigma factor [Steroidobacteraceae bacterium]